MNENRDLVIHILFEEGKLNVVVFKDKVKYELDSEQSRQFLRRVFVQPVNFFRQSPDLDNPKKQDLYVEYDNCIVNIYDISQVNKLELKDYTAFSWLEKEIQKYQQRKAAEERVRDEELKKTIEARRQARKVKRRNKIIRNTVLIAVGAAAVIALVAPKIIKDANSRAELDKGVSITTTAEQYESSNVYGPFMDEEQSTVEESVELPIDEPTQDSAEVVEFAWEDRSNTEKVQRMKNLYGAYIEKWSKVYGLDQNYVLATICQESISPEEDIRDDKAARGPMQIEKSPWVDGGYLRAYNFEEKKWDVIYDPDGRNYENFIEKLKNPDYAIQVGCMMAQDGLNIFNYYFEAGTENYNKGQWTMNQFFKACEADTGISKQQCIENHDNVWMNYRSTKFGGAENYFEKRCSWLPSGTELHFKRYNAETNEIEDVSIRLVNTLVEEKTMSR